MGEGRFKSRAYVHLNSNSSVNYDIFVKLKGVRNHTVVNLLRVTLQAIKGVGPSY